MSRMRDGVLRGVGWRGRSNYFVGSNAWALVPTKKPLKIQRLFILFGAQERTRTSTMLLAST
jgi:hypothetical protein